MDSTLLLGLLVFILVLFLIGIICWLLLTREDHFDREARFRSELLELFSEGLENNSREIGEGLAKALWGPNLKPLDINGPITGEDIKDVEVVNYPGHELDFDLEELERNMAEKEDGRVEAQWAENQLLKETPDKES